MVPQTERNVLINLHVDFELQKNYQPGYPVIKRGVYYGCRKLSAQLDKISPNGKGYKYQEKVLSYIPDPDNEVCQKEVADMLSMVAYAEEQGEKKGKKIGTIQGENRLGMLMNILLKNKKYSDAERASEDKEYREKLYKEYGL